MPAAPAAPVALPLAADLASQFERMTWTRGVDCALDERVLWAEILVDDTSRGAGFRIQGEVLGSGHLAHEQTLTLTHAGEGAWRVFGRCTCPVGHNCKHVVAVLVDALSQDWFDAPAAPAETPGAQPAAPPPPRAQPKLDLWLTRQEETQRAQSQGARQVHTSLYHSAPADDHVHVVVLDVHTEDQAGCHWLTMWPGRARQLKSKAGGLGKVSLPAAHGGYGSPWDAHGRNHPLNDLLRHWHSGQQHTSWRASTRHPTAPHNAVRDELGAHALELVAQSGELVRLTPERTVGPKVGWGPPRPLRWVWVAEPESASTKVATSHGAAPAWRLQPDLGDAHTLLCLGEPLLYLDTAQNVCGRAEAPGASVADVRRWLTLPRMTEDWMGQHAARLRALLPTLPEPVAGQIGREIRGVAPVPCLRVVAHPRPKEAVLQLHLSFDYDGVRHSWGEADAPMQVLDTPQGRVQLWRQPQLEDAARIRLYHAAYVPPPKGPAIVWQASASMHPGPHQRDLALLESDFAEWRALGWQIDIDQALQAALGREGRLELNLQEAQAPAEGAGAVAGELQDRGWFDLSMGFVVGHERINLLPLLPQLLNRWVGWEAQASARQQPWPANVWLTDEQGGPLRLPTAPLRPWLAALYELVGHRDVPEGDTLALGQLEALRLATAAPAEGAAPVALPHGLMATLRPYQAQGYSWLQHLGQHGLGGVLADDMGLGKTLQTIAHLLADKQAGRLVPPALIVAPTSLVGNWRSELQRFAPDLKPLVLHGQDRHEHHASLAAHDVVITTYPLLLRDEAVLTAQTWSVVVLDEAQAIKNAKTRLAGVVQGLQARQRLCLTGTPMENHLGEVWSLFHFLMPGYLANEQRFKQVFRTPIEKHGDTERLALLRTRLQPFMLRRTKAAVAAELPPKVEAIEHIELAPDQANLYEVIRATTEAQVRKALDAKGLARSHITVLDALLKLRQVCCDPRLLKLDAARKVKHSAKMDWLMDNLPALIADGRRVLVFSAFSSMLSLIEAALAQHTDLKWAKLTGQSKDREAIVARFTSGEVPLFLISLKAGGVGLNLPQADTVIHVDPWWNPAAEDQATDRAHRMGQQQTVFVYKLVAQGTLEERIVAMQARKAALAQGLHGDTEADTAAADRTRLTEADLDWLLQPIGSLRSVAS
jgi:superfamily II DNA or RNA helicase